MKISGVKKLKLICSSDDSEMKKTHPEYQKDLPVKKGAVSIHLPAYSARFYQVVE
jgi:1,4-alpha-glucan branching enzyme